MNTWDYMELLRSKHGGCSDYRLFKMLGIAQAALVRYRKGKQMDDSVCVKVAELLGLPPGEVIAEVRAARAEADGQPDLVPVWRATAGMWRQYGASRGMVGRDRIELSTNWLKANRSGHRRRRVYRAVPTAMRTGVMGITP